MSQPTSPLVVKEETLEQKRIHEGKVINLRVDQVKNAFGHTVTREVVEHPGGVCVMPLLADGRFVFVKQYRYPTQDFLLEFPAGKLDVAGEAPFEAIQRELIEETGYSSSEWEDLGYIYTAPGFCNERIYLYKANNLTAVTTQNGPQEDEAIEPLVYTVDEVKTMVSQGKIQDGKTLALLGHYFLANA